MPLFANIDFRIRPADGVDRVDLIGTDSEPYTRVYGSGFTDDRSIEALLRELDEHSFVGVMQAEWEDDDPTSVNIRVASAVRDHPEYLIAGVATTDPRREDGLDVLKHAHDFLGLKGWNFQPGFLKFSALDEQCQGIFEYCEANGHPVTIHTGINFSRTGPISFGHPSNIDALACRYPELKIVCNHGAWPWVTEMLAVLWKHPQVYADFGAIAPKRMVGPKGGWEPVAHWMNSMVSKQILLASDWPMMRYARLIGELPELGLSAPALENYRRSNAARFIDEVWGTNLVSRIESSLGETGGAL